jgi:hypothetical protein
MFWMVSEDFVMDSAYLLAFVVMPMIVVLLASIGTLILGTPQGLCAEQR